MVRINKKKFMGLVGDMLGQEFAKEAPKVSTRLSKTFLSTMKIQGNKITYTLPHYARYVIEGSAPHEIRAKNKKILAVPIKDWNGKTPNKYGSGKFPMLSKDGTFVLLGKKVMHPGNQPNPFMDNVLHRKLGDIITRALELSIY